MVTVSLLWIYFGCRASARALGAVQAVLPPPGGRRPQHLHGAAGPAR